MPENTDVQPTTPPADLRLPILSEYLAKQEDIGPHLAKARARFQAEQDRYAESDKAKEGPKRREAIRAHLTHCETPLAERGDDLAPFAIMDNCSIPPMGDTIDGIIYHVREQFPGTPAEIIRQDVENVLADDGKIREVDTNADGQQVWRLSPVPSSNTPEGEDTPAPDANAKLLKEIPPLDRDSRDWTMAHNVPNTKTQSLKTRRSEKGSTTARNGNYGIDSGGRWWRRDSDNEQLIWYYVPILPPSNQR